MENAITYADDGVNYSITPATRVSQIPSSANTTGIPISMVKESFLNGNGSYDTLFGSIFGNGTDLPGPRYISSCARFNGRPAWFADKIVDWSIYFDNIHSAMFPSPADGLDGDYFKLTQPWWCAGLVRFSDVTDGGHEGVIMDGNPGVATISPKIVSGDGLTGTWGVIQAECWNNGFQVGGTIESTHAADPTRTYLFIYQVNTTSSRFITMYRDANGVIQTSDVNGTACSSGRAGAQAHIGWSNTQYGTFYGWKNGIVTAAEIAALKKWAGPYMPAAGTIATELV